MFFFDYLDLIYFISSIKANKNISVFIQHTITMRSNQPRRSKLDDRDSKIVTIMNLKLTEENKKNHQAGIIKNPASNIR